MEELKGVRSGRLLTGVCVLLSAHFAMSYMSLTVPMIRFEDYRKMNGTFGPFAYRMLPALLWNACAWVLGPLHRRLPGLHLPNLNKPLASNEEWFLMLLSFFAMLGTLAVARRLLRAIDQRPEFEWMALAIGYAAYFDTTLVLNRNLFYPYDLPALFFFMLLVYLAYMGRGVAFTLALVPAMLNKETAIMAVLVFFGLQFGRRPLARLVAICAGMGALAIAIRLAQKMYFARICPACQRVADDQLRSNLHQLANPLFWISAVSVFGFGWVALIVFWKYVPRTLRVTAFGVYGVWLAGMMVVGIMREVRIFSELSALLLLTVAVGVHGWLEEHRRVEAIL